MNTIPLDHVHSMLIDPLAPGESAEREFEVPEGPLPFRQAHFLSVSSVVPLRLALGRAGASTFSMILREEGFVGMITTPGKYKIAVRNVSNVASAVHINVTS